MWHLCTDLCYRYVVKKACQKTPLFWLWMQDSFVKINRPQEPDKDVKAMMEICETGWVCRNCGKITKHRYDIKEHVERVHQKRRPFVCIRCEQSYSTKKMYEAHGRRHTGEKIYSCHTCNKAFTRKGTLRKHELIHLKVWRSMVKLFRLNYWMCSFWQVLFSWCYPNKSVVTD